MRKSSQLLKSKFGGEFGGARTGLIYVYSFGPVPLTEHDNLTSSRIYVHDIKARSATETIFLSPEKRDQTKQFSKKGKR